MKPISLTADEIVEFCLAWDALANEGRVGALFRKKFRIIFTLWAHSNRKRSISEFIAEAVNIFSFLEPSDSL